MYLLWRFEIFTAVNISTLQIYFIRNMTWLQNCFIRNLTWDIFIRIVHICQI